MKLNSEINELELIKKYQEKPNDEIALYFYDKFKEAALNIITTKINNRFSSIPLDRSDFYNTIWKSVKTALKDFDESKKSSLFNFVVSNGYWLGLREAIKFLKNSHIILNNSYSYERLLEKGINKTNQINNLISYQDVTKNFINNVLEFNIKYSKDQVKRVIYLKSLGHSIIDIQKITKYPINTVRGILNEACKIAKKLYE